MTGQNSSCSGPPPSFQGHFKFPEYPTHQDSQHQDPLHHPGLVQEYLLGDGKDFPSAVVFEGLLQAVATVAVQRRILLCLLPRNWADAGCEGREAKGKAGAVSSSHGSPFSLAPCFIHLTSQPGISWEIGGELGKKEIKTPLLATVFRKEL